MTGQHNIHAKDAPQFIEGQVFRMELPVPEVDDTISDTIKQRLSKSVILLFNNPGLKTPELAKAFSVSNTAPLVNWSRLKIEIFV